MGPSRTSARASSEIRLQGRSAFLDPGLGVRPKEIRACPNP